MIDFGVTQNMVDAAFLSAEITGAKLELSQLAEFERTADLEIASYVNAKDGHLNDSDRETVKVIRDTISEEREKLKVRLFAATEIQKFENSFSNLPIQ